MMLESAVVSQIAVRDLTFEADMIQARTFRAFETYLVVTLVYLGLSIGVRRLLIWFGQRTLSVECDMIEFTFWDILRNLLFATRWTILLSLVAFVGGASVGIAILLARISKRTCAEAVRQGLHRPLPGNAAADAALPHVLRPADRSASASSPGRRRCWG